MNVGNPTPNLKQIGLNEAFAFSDAACSGRVVGLLTHGQVRTDKDDVHPQKNLVEMLLTL